MVEEKEKVLALAKGFAEARGWELKEPVRIRLKRQLFPPRKVWIVFSNAETLGQNVSMRILAKSGELLSAAFLSR